MNKLKNFIFFSICEIALVVYKNTNCSTFNGFCLTFKTTLLTENLNSRDLSIFYRMSDYIELIYGISNEESQQYIVDFFILEKYLVFSDSVRLINEHFKNSLA